MANQVSSSAVCTCGHMETAHYNSGACLVDLEDNSLRWRSWKNRCSCGVFVENVVTQSDSLPLMCKCGHTADQHLGNTDYCLIEMSDNSIRHSNWHTKCSCLHFEPVIEHGIHIATLLSDTGEARILFEFEDVHLQIMPDTCAQIALQLLSAVYASRAEQALFKYAQDNLIDPDTLVRFVRT